MARHQKLIMTIGESKSDRYQILLYLSAAAAPTKKCADGESRRPYDGHQDYQKPVRALQQGDIKTVFILQMCKKARNTIRIGNKNNYGRRPTKI